MAGSAVLYSSFPGRRAQGKINDEIPKPLKVVVNSRETDQEKIVILNGKEACHLYVV
ncbi:hypothetical protein HK101_003298, partial [Irineochytrium annulatum]